MFDAMQYAAVISLGLLVLALWRPWRRQRIVHRAVVFVGFVLLLGLPSGASAAEIRRGPTPASRPAKPSITTSSFSEAPCGSMER